MKYNLFKTILFISVFFLCVTWISSCSDTTLPPVPTNDQEIITSLKISVIDSANGQIYNYFYRDLDGIGGNPPSQWDTIKLNPNRIYLTTVSFLNESNPNNIINVSSEIKSEQANHIICYEGVLTNTVFSRTDSDGTYPLGLESKWKTGNSTRGNLTITLKHQPGLKNGSCAPGETDVEVKFPYILK